MAATGMDSAWASSRYGTGGARNRANDTSGNEMDLVMWLGHRASDNSCSTSYQCRHIFPVGITAEHPVTVAQGEHVGPLAEGLDRSDRSAIDRDRAMDPGKGPGGGAREERLEALPHLMDFPVDPKI